MDNLLCVWVSVGYKVWLHRQALVIGQSGLNCPVLKHGPRSLTFVQVQRFYYKPFYCGLMKVIAREVQADP